jgi:hypothetical protein
MKNLRRLCVALAFTFALTIPAFGGLIETPPAPPPPAQQSAPGQIETGAPGGIQTPPGAPGEIQTPGGIETPPAPAASATEVALNLLQGLLGLL